MKIRFKNEIDKSNNPEIFSSAFVVRTAKDFFILRNYCNFMADD